MTGVDAWRGPRKYRNVPTNVDGILFASKREAKRWGELQLMARANYITDLKRQVRFALDVNGQPICHYVADFTYQRLGKLVVEDAKGFATDSYRLKKRLMSACHQIQIVEV